jgi:hypothetical protein
VSEPSASILPDWLAQIKEGSFPYPSAGDDLDEALGVFAPHVDKFSFCDLHYGKGLKLRPAFQSGSGYKLISSSITGDPLSSLSTKDGHREKEPSALNEIYENEANFRRVAVRRLCKDSIRKCTPFIERARHAPSAIPLAMPAEPDDGKPAQWHWFTVRGETERPLFAFAGIWRRWKGPIKKDGPTMDRHLFLHDHEAQCLHRAHQP